MTVKIQLTLHSKYSCENEQFLWYNENCYFII